MLLAWPSQPSELSPITKRPHAFLFTFFVAQSWARFNTHNGAILAHVARSVARVFPSICAFVRVCVRVCVYDFNEVREGAAGNRHQHEG